MGELLRTLVGEDALAFTTSQSRYSMLEKIITPLTVDRQWSYSVRSDLGKSPVGKRAQEKAIHGHTTIKSKFHLPIRTRMSLPKCGITMPDRTASTVARALVDRWVAVFGIPITLLSDNGPCFASKVFQVLTKVLE
jgi:hypothetical protein